MPIVLPAGLPAADLLRDEGIAVDHPAADGRDLRVVLVNLMPDRPATETQFARLLAASRHRVALALAVPDGVAIGEGTHLARFYRPWAEVAAAGVDAVIVTGAPVERLPFAEVRYWPGIARILDWTAAARVPSWFVCWAAQAALWHRHGIPKRDLADKASGVFAQVVTAPDAPVLAGIGDRLLTPVSRHTTTCPQDVARCRPLRVLAASAATGLGLAEEPAIRAHYMPNHPEYDADTLAREYARDLATGRPAPLPAGYFPGDDARAAPVAFWRPQARRLFGNWLEGVAAARAGTDYLGPAKNSCIARSMNATSRGRRKDAAM